MDGRILATVGAPGRRPHAVPGAGAPGRRERRGGGPVRGRPATVAERLRYGVFRKARKSVLPACEPYGLL